MPTNLFSQWIKTIFGLEGSHPRGMERRRAPLFLRLSSKSRAAKKRALRRWVKPQLNVLEDRLAPAVYTVNTLTDTGSGSGLTGDLRYCLNQSNNDTGPDTITFAASLTQNGPATVSLTNGTLYLQNHNGTTIQGPGANLLTIDGGNLGFAIFYLYPNASVVLSGLTIAHGGTYGTTDGGGIYDYNGTLTINNCVLSSNSAFYGGGIFAEGGTLVVSNSTLANNKASFGGGGLYDLYETVTLTNSTVANNSAVYYGGGIENDYESTLGISNSTLSGNSVNQPAFNFYYGGGGVWNAGYSTVTVNNSTFFNNSAPGQSAGGLLSFGIATVAFSTFSGNSGVALNNTAGSGGGFNGYNNGTLNLSNSVLGNTVNAPDFINNGYVYTFQNNVIQSEGNIGGGGLVGVNPDLSALGYYGGPTQTFAPLSGSPVFAESAAYPTYGGGGSNGTQNFIYVSNPALLGIAPNTVIMIDSEQMLVTAVNNSQLTVTRGINGTTVTQHNGGATVFLAADQRGLPRPASGSTIGAFQAQTLVVNTTADGNVTPFGQLDLRQAVNLANVRPGSDTITFDSTVFATPQTITLTGGLLTLSDSSGTTTIQGPGANLLTIDGNNATEVFRVNSGVSAVLDSLTIAHGSFAGGGGIFNYGTLTVSNSTLTSNSASSYGGGIFNDGTLTVSNSCLVSNSAPAYGGGIYNEGTLTVSDSTFLNNSAINRGHDVGGGVVNYGTLTVSDSTFSGNSADGGGAIANAGTLTVNDSTLANNTASTQKGGGIYSIIGATLNLANTIVANSLVGVDLYNTGSVATAQNNLIGSQTGSPIQNGVNGNIVGANPLLSPLGYYGGGTQTFALLPGSPAIDAGSNTAASGLGGRDERGVLRIINGTVDIGAFESQGFTLSVTSGSGESTPINTAFGQPLVVTVSSAYGEPVAGGQVTFTAPASGASASLTGTPATIGANGQASVTATANGIMGQNYSVTASAAGASAVGITLSNTEAPSLVVTTRADESNPYDGQTSLREAIAYANTLAGASAITFQPGLTGTITLTGGVLTLNEIRGAMTIQGPGANLLTIDGNRASTVFSVGSGVSAVLNGLTIANGADNTGLYAGGINNLGTLTVGNCTLSGNSSTGFGGAIDNLKSLTVTNSTLSGNSAEFGGGLCNQATFTVSNSTLSGNSAEFGGGLCNLSSMTVTDCTLSANSGQFGGGIFDKETLSLANTIVANSASGSDLYVPNGGTIAAAQNNLIGSQTGSSIQNGVNGNIVGKAPLLSTLGNYGGPTQTFALLPGSPAINAGSNALAVDAHGNPLTTDQRGPGFPRVVSGTVDIGAFEFTPSAYIVTTTADSGPGSLRDAINQVNADTSHALYASPSNPSVDEIDFAISTVSDTGGGYNGATNVATITPQSALPLITNAVTIDGTTQPGFTGAPLIELNGTNAGPGAIGLNITAGNSTVRGLVIDQFGSSALEVDSGQLLVSGSTVSISYTVDAPTILVTGGSLTLRNDTVGELTKYGARYSDAAIAITGGTVDLGTMADPGNNIFNITNAGQFIHNTTSSSISTTGDTFEIDGIPDPKALSFTTLANFNGSNGAFPLGNVVADNSGNLFGTTQASSPLNEFGNPTGNAELYEIAKGSGTIAAVASLPDGYDGGGLIVDSNGNLFGIANTGVFEIKAGSLTATMLAPFNSTNGSIPQGPLFEDGSGDLFGTTDYGGALGGGTVFELPAGSSTISTVAPLPHFGFFLKSPYFGVVADSAGNLFGTTQDGGANQQGSVFEVPVHGGGTVITLASFNGANGDFPSANAPLVEDGSGNLFGVTVHGGASNVGTVFEIPANDRTSIVTLASFDGSNGEFPEYLYTDTSDNLFGATFGNNTSTLGPDAEDPTVFEVPAGSGTILTLGSFVGTNDQRIIGLTQDNSGNLIGATEFGGPFGGGLGYGTIFEVTDPNPYAGNQLLPDRQHTPTVVTLSSSDPNGDPLTYVVTNPANGTLSGTAPNLIYTPNSGFTGNDSFQVRVTDTVTGLVSNTATVSLLAPVTPTINVTDAGGIYNGSSFPAIATVTGRSGIPTSSLEGAGPTLDYAQLDANNNVIADLGSSAPSQAGSYKVTASFPGSTTYLPATGTSPFVIAKASPSMTAAAGPSVLYGTGVPLTDSATLTGPAGMTGTITFVLHDPSGAVVDTETATVNGAGVYSTPSGYVPARTGTYQWSASYSGDANDNQAIAAVMRSEDVIPVVASYVGTTPGNPDPYIAGNLVTSSSSVSYTLTFNEPVTGVDASQFDVATTGMISAGSVQVQPVDSATYTVTIGGISGLGTLGLNLMDNGGIQDLAGNTLPQGVAQAVGQAYTIDTNPPVVQSFAGTTTTNTDPNNPAALLTNATSISYALTFSQPVTGVNAAEFGMTSGFGTPSLQVTPVSGSNGTAYTIVVNGITGSGEFSVLFNTLTGITDQGGFAFNLTGAASVPAFPSAQTYTIDQVPPVALAITPTTPASRNLITSAVSVSYAVTFSKPATGVDASAFALTETGTVAVGSVQATVDPNNPNNWIVTLSGITGNGKLGLQLASNNHIVDLAGNALSQAFAPVTLQDLPAITLPQGDNLMAVADINGDGMADLILTNSYTNSMNVMLGNGDGTFQSPQPFAVGVAPFNGVIADVNGDGQRDLVMVNPGTDTVSVLLNQGNGTFGPPQTYVTSTDPSVNAQAVAVADINGDGHPDLVVANSIDQGWNSLYGQPANVSVLLNNGDGTFQAPQTLSSSGPIVNASSVAVADVNGDGKPDIAVGTSSHYNFNSYNSYGNRAVLLLNDGSGHFTNVQNLGSPGGGFWGPLQVAFADLSGSGKADLIIGTPGGSTGIELNNGNGTFTETLPLPVGPGANVPFAADLTGTGNVNDLVVSNPGASTVNVFVSVPPVYTIDTPTAHIAANANVSQAAHTASLLLTATDPLGSQELAAGFTYAIDWGDGTAQNPDTTTVSATANNGSGAPESHTYADGSYLVSVTATNKDGAVSSAATSLVVVSSKASDSITLSGGAGAGQVAVSVNNATATTFSPTDLVLASGQGGSDAFTVNFGSTLTTPISLAGSNSAGDTLTVNGDSSATNVITKTPGQISWGSPVTETVSRTGIPNTVVNANGASQNYINDPGGSTTINGGPGANTITITATTGNGVVIHGGASANTYVVDLGSLAGPVTIQNNNNAATNSLVVNGAAGNNTISVSGNRVTSGAQTITDTAVLTNLTVNGGSGNNQLTVSALTVPVQSVTLVGGGGTTTYNVNSGTVNIVAGTGVNILNVNGGTVAGITAPAGDSQPLVFAHSYTVLDNGTLSLPAKGVLASDVSANGQALTAVLASSPAHGTVSLKADGSFTYAPAANFVGSDSFTYQAKGSDGTLSAVAPVTIQVTYHFSGFLAPLNSNIALALNRTVPIKFQLTDYNGASVSGPGAVTSLQVLNAQGTNVLTNAGSTALRYDSSAKQFIANWQTKGLPAGTYAVTLVLADGTTYKKSVQLSANGSSAALLVDGAGIATTATGALLGGDIELYVDNSNGDLTADELARIQDAVTAVDAMTEPFGVKVEEVTDPSQADVTLILDSTSAVGGYADGVLGCTTDAGQITIINGWNFYAGSAATQIGMGQYDFETVVTHELGHALGLGHSADANSVMYATLNTGTVNRTLATVDLNVADSDTTDACGLHAALGNLVRVPDPSYANGGRIGGPYDHASSDMVFAMLAGETSRNAVGGVVSMAARDTFFADTFAERTAGQSVTFTAANLGAKPSDPLLTAPLPAGGEDWLPAADESGSLVSDATAATGVTQGIPTTDRTAIADLRADLVVALDDVFSSGLFLTA